ncbi:hypothetical protein GQ600_22110 [Phytophthora cactorum]|nr:hypothetical protein GQ600_22110 [Phytophthora cactorum]
MACGCGYLYACWTSPRSSSTSSNTSRSLRRPFRLVGAQLQSLSSAKQGEPSFTTQVASAATTEVLVHLCKLGLQCSLALFLFRRRVLTKNQTIPTLCLCFSAGSAGKWLKPACTRCYHPILFGKYSTAIITHESSFPRRNGGFVPERTLCCAIYLRLYYQFNLWSSIPSVLLRAIADQVEAVPAYLGSKNLVLATLFFLLPASAP